MIKPGQTTRQAMEALVKVEPICSGCHTLTDPVGFTFENFDAIGRVRRMDNGLPVDTASAPAGIGAVADAVELSAKVAAAPEASACFADGWLAYATMRDGEDDQCSVDGLRKHFADGGQNIRDLLLAVVQSPAFLYSAAP
jgi:hypothetical protein